MDKTTTRGLKEGIGLGMVAGVLFAVMEVAGAAIMGNPPLMPLRMFASIALGQAALEMTASSTAVAVGSAVHLALSGLFGLVYGLVNTRLPVKVRTSWGEQAWVGLVFGVALWFVNFQVIARLAYPWFLMSPQLLQLLMHALFFGLPLGLLYAGAERHAYPGRGAPTPT